MSDVLNLSEVRVPKLTRAESLAVARAARAAKKIAGQAEAKPVVKNSSAELDFWGLALLTTMQNFQAKSAQSVDSCLSAADRALEHWKKKREELS